MRAALGRAYGRSEQLAARGCVADPDAGALVLKATHAAEGLSLELTSLQRSLGPLAREARTRLATADA